MQMYLQVRHLVVAGVVALGRRVANQGSPGYAVSCQGQGLFVKHLDLQCFVSGVDLVVKLAHGPVVKFLYYADVV